MKNILKTFLLCAFALTGMFLVSCSANKSNFVCEEGQSGSSIAVSNNEQIFIESEGFAKQRSVYGDGDEQNSVEQEEIPTPPAGRIVICYDYGAASRFFGSSDKIKSYDIVQISVGIVQLPEINEEYSEAFLGWFDANTNEKVSVGDKPENCLEVYAKFDINKVTFAGLFENGKFVKTWDEIKQENPEAFSGTTIVRSNYFASGYSFSCLENLQGDLVIGNDITEIEGYSFLRCNLLTSVVIPDSVTTIGPGAFSRCLSLQKVKLSNNLTKIEYGTFLECEALTSVEIPNSVTRIGDFAFKACKNLTSVSIPDCVVEFGDVVFNECPNLQYNVFDNAYYLGSLENPYFVLMKAINSNISSCVIHDDTKVICEHAFDGCCNLNGILIPNKVTTIGDDAFFNCQSLTSITIPDNVVRLGYRAFSRSGVNTVWIGKNVSKLNKSQFINCGGITSITISPENTRYHSDGNCVIETATKTLLFGCRTSVIPTDGSVTIIGSGAFQEFGDVVTVSSYPRLTSIVIPSCVTEIRMSAFYGCEGLTNVTFEKNSVLRTIGNSAFYNCRNLQSITIPRSVVNILARAFVGSGLTNVVFENTSKWYKAREVGQMSIYHLEISRIYVDECSHYEVAEMLRSATDGDFTTDASYENEEICPMYTYWEENRYNYF